MEPKDILIRLVKDGHISDEEFKAIYDALIPTIHWSREYPQHPMPWQEPYPTIWHGITDPLTGDPLGPSYIVTSTEPK